MTRCGMLLVRGLATLGMLATPSAHASEPTYPVCPDGRYVLIGHPVRLGKHAAPISELTIVGGTIAIGSCTDAVSLRGTRYGTLVRARVNSCQGVKGALRIAARIMPTCEALVGTIKRKHHADSLLVARRGHLPGCGDGVLDKDGGEECE